LNVSTGAACSAIAAGGAATRSAASSCTANAAMTCIGDIAADARKIDYHVAAENPSAGTLGIAAVTTRAGIATSSNGPDDITAIAAWATISASNFVVVEPRIDEGEVTGIDPDPASLGASTVAPDLAIAAEIVDATTVAAIIAISGIRAIGIDA